ncbi:MAG: SRPBCC domain-containing protein [Chitinophagales bacterium]|nr:SRPBCC domain-containing protein [Chitinophagales bacterium]
MKDDLLYDLSVDKAAKTVTIVREFAAELSLVWDAFTKPELLDQWWAPKPWLSRTKAMNFEAGGRRFYAMVSPEGEERWAVQRFTVISPQTHYQFFNAFADKDEHTEPEGSDWDLRFSEANGLTTVTIAIFNESLERMERLIEMGFREGFAMALQNLDVLLEALPRRH